MSALRFLSYRGIGSNRDDASQITLITVVGWNAVLV
ncbi:hypothetical protein AFE_1134 [Acidithiobacillus ferrooxidans ATCC 23270]|uniref:Uncharacterized protein n=1 Tax=Acidithiobacillus ferrooxidans (strain ATCC 23270 / DSM 14882 / CIP 104768 / NCIMB 8455) TaxID=243159 RepID=B7J882_ACIF2|nr:hypothetical protein AFE_1134 [Acidithiobacillus ferrooxidans ATCC 23270]